MIYLQLFYVFLPKAHCTTRDTITQTMIVKHNKNNRKSIDMKIWDLLKFIFRQGWELYLEYMSEELRTGNAVLHKFLFNILLYIYLL